MNKFIPEPSDKVSRIIDLLRNRSDSDEQIALLEQLRRMIQHVQSRGARTGIVAGAAIQLAETESPVDVLTATLNEAIKLTGAERGFVMMWNEEKRSLEKVISAADENFSETRGPDNEFCKNVANLAFHSGTVLIHPTETHDTSVCGQACTNKLGLCSVLAAPLIAETDKGQQKLGVVYLDIMNKEHDFTADDGELMRQFAALAALSIAHSRTTKQLRTAYHQTVSALVKALEAKDKYTRGHSERVAEYAFRCGKHMGLSPDRLVMLHSAALLHDVGKIGIRDAVLHKPGKLTDEEYEHIKLHAELSEEIVKGLSYLDDERVILAASQEHYDGSGYPKGTKGDEISIEAYIIQVADAWDAMTSTRVYRVAMPKEAAVAELKKWSGKQFHPDVVNAFLEMIEIEGLIPSE
ncbi:MAG TPA: HD domain-containing protein [Firmicutes bacterium]|nr:HD domain-containing protein [Bacillota bacterium]